MFIKSSLQNDLSYLTLYISRMQFISFCGPTYCGMRAQCNIVIRIHRSSSSFTKKPPADLSLGRSSNKCGFNTSAKY